MLLLLVFAALPTLPAPLARTVDFDRDVRPLLARACFSCHGPDKQRGGLRLDHGPSALTGGTSGPVLKKKDSANSRLIHVVAGLDPDAKMPPGEGKALKPDEVALLRAWIDQGPYFPAKDWLVAPARNVHWSFRPVVRPAVPAAAHQIDGFVAARLAAEKLDPSPPADRVTQLRRVALDLTGLPPAPEAVDAFLADERPDAFERQVDRLLASPHYGERWGRHWLDAARYADSDGFEKDTGRPHAWRYRHWVIDALNRNLPYDRFVVEQLAGDLLPGATVEQKVATGFHRNTLTNKEGGVDKEQFRVEAVVDRVNTTARAFLGLTLACAQCHDHKYDPLSHAEYYRFFAFFNSDEERDIPAPVWGVKSPPEKGKPGPLLAQTMALGKERPTHVMLRGDFLRPGAEVRPGTPAVLPPLAAKSPNRLHLARWITSAENPLTARVFVNQAWHKFFGRGLVASMDDFGTQGEKPSHPELLDWLAAEFASSGWDVKGLTRLIVTSDAYRQSSRLRPELAARDPNNVLLARQARQRLEAEAVRDQMLSAGGLLTPQIGGTSVRPPQAAGISELTYAGSAKWLESGGTDRYRRGMYTWFQRTSPHPMLMTFDAPDGNLCTVRRERSNTPLQALTLLNDVAFVECAKAL
ncbi:MAG: PSD1 and planctomycete cytochrome C domain-containing protein, partial [Gemmataceae bacterium]